MRVITVSPIKNINFGYSGLIFNNLADFISHDHDDARSNKTISPSPPKYHKKGKTTLKSPTDKRMNSKHGSPKIITKRWQLQTGRRLNPVRLILKGKSDQKQLQAKPDSPPSRDINDSVQNESDRSDESLLSQDPEEEKGKSFEILSTFEQI